MTRSVRKVTNGTTGAYLVVAVEFLCSFQTSFKTIKNQDFTLSGRALPVHVVRLEGRKLSVQGMLPDLVKVDVVQEEHPANTVSAVRRSG